MSEEVVETVSIGVFEDIGGGKATTISGARVILDDFDDYTDGGFVYFHNVPANRDYVLILSKEGFVTRNIPVHMFTYDPKWSFQLKRTAEVPSIPLWKVAAIALAIFGVGGTTLWFLTRD